jgi:hypothetical protein
MVWRIADSWRAEPRGGRRHLVSRAPGDAVHVWQGCHGCRAAPIIGDRYDCETCPTGPDIHLCGECYAAFVRGELEHPAPASSLTESSSVRHEFTRRPGSPLVAPEWWTAVPNNVAPAPPIEDRFVLRPEFCCGERSYFGSYAFAVEMAPRGRRLVLTALHVLGELARAAGVDCSIANDSYTGEELPRLINRVNLYDPFAPRWFVADVGAAGQMLIAPDARTGEEEPRCQRDVAAFVTDSSLRLAAAPLARAAPKVGELVWLVVDVGGGGRAAAAVVVESTEQTMIVRFTTAPSHPRVTSGAPFIDRRGHVVGVNIGGGFLAGRRYGHGCHAESIRRHLNLG